ncbi:MAG: 4Fe-4S dicluster domain-containing protein [Bacteroidales bacterium]|jgi:NADH-quinone oxidoreductase subunit I|nr:4Fe-4S dicluster domain-containing protein [Bacteroidales bacterium]
MIQYIKDLFSGIWNLLQGMKITMINFIRKPITECYPENRGTKVYAERFRGELTMPHNANNEHKCTGCGICQMNCPNGTITVKTKQITTDDGKTKKILDQYLYDLGSCTFCGLCTMGCPQKAIVWSNNFEHSVYRRATLVKQLNKEGSKLEEKKVVAPQQEEKKVINSNTNQQQ